MTQIEEENSNNPSAHDWFESTISVHSLCRVCFLLLTITIVGSAQQHSSRVTPSGTQELSKAKVTTDSKKEDGLSRVSTERVSTVPVISDSGAETAGSALSSSSPNAEVNTSEAPASKGEADNSLEEFSNRITDPDMTQDGRDERFKFKPEIFVQARYSFWPTNNTRSEAGSHFSFTRLEIGWAGRVSRRFGAGIEIQFQSLIKGSHRELINDAFVEYYLTDNFSVKAGQFVKPFGFDAQQSSSVRESPERGMFVGYFFPGGRDRGVMLSGNLNFLRSRSLEGITYSLAIFRGNVFFSDAKPQSNYAARARKIFEGGRFAVGVSMQLGQQPLPEGLSGKSIKTILGADFQYVKGRIGLRGELVAGNTPTSLFTGDSILRFRTNAHSAGGALFAVYRLSNNDDVYARYDQFNGDPAVGRSVRAFNFGYVRRLRKSSKLSFDYQVKNRRSFNDDAVNSRLTTTWSMTF
jgi:hypothetical protein